MLYEHYFFQIKSSSTFPTLNLYYLAAGLTKKFHFGAGGLLAFVVIVMDGILLLVLVFSSVREVFLFLEKLQNLLGKYFLAKHQFFRKKSSSEKICI